jgi:glycosyltransferase involved in cell wall biosynthesis
VWLRKKAVFDQFPRHQLTVTTPSRWLADLAASSPLLGRFEIKVIPNGVDTTLYQPKDRQAARRSLGVPTDARVVLFVASDTGNPRKGFKHLKEALSSLTDVGNLLLLSLGQRTTWSVGSIPHQSLGAISDEATMVAAYAAADVFVIPSLQEVFGQTVIESMACGTPVVGFDAGGIPDMVRNEQTGLLVPVGDVPALAAAIRRVLLEPSLSRHLSPNCRSVVEREYSVVLQARRFADLYKTVLSAS